MNANPSLAALRSHVRDLQPGQSHAAHIAQEALKQLFAPRLDLSQMDINSLDGQNLSGRAALQTIFE